MKIAIPTQGRRVNQHFNQSDNFTVFEADEGKIVGKEIISAVGFNHQHDHIAGLLNSTGATVVITGGIGSGALSALQDVGFEVLIGASGEAQTVAELYALGEFNFANTSNHYHQADANQSGHLFH